MNVSALNKKQENYTLFSPKKDCRKMKINFILPIIIPITPVRVIDHRSCYSVIDSSILQELFSSVPTPSTQDVN